MNLWLLLVLLSVTVFRVTKLITRDQFPLIMWPRETIVSFLYPEYADKNWRLERPTKVFRAHCGGFGRTIAYLMVCDWCMSVWVSAGFMWLLMMRTDWYHDIGWIGAVTYAATASTVTGWIASKEDNDAES